MGKIIKVKAVWEFEVDVEDFSEKFVDVKGLAKDLTQRELQSMINNTEINAEDFNYVIDEKPENKKLKIKLSDDRELVAEVNELDADNTEMAVYVVDETDKQNIVYQDICLVREGIKNDVECLVWGNKDEEDYTDFFSIGKYESED